MSLNAHIMKVQILHKIKYDPKVIKDHIKSS